MAVTFFAVWWNSRTGGVHLSEACARKRGASVSRTTTALEDDTPAGGDYWCGVCARPYARQGIIATLSAPSASTRVQVDLIEGETK